MSPDEAEAGASGRLRIPALPRRPDPGRALSRVAVKAAVRGGGQVTSTAWPRRAKLYRAR